jgi:5-methylcytosine-specific restriction endonuclease McrA
LGNADTIDHIHPVSKGGKSTWLNCVASCKKCNQKKNNRSLAEIGWDLQIKPYVPTRVELAERKIEMTELKQLER